MAAAAPAHNKPLDRNHKDIKIMDDDYTGYLISKDIHTGEDSTNRMGEVTPKLSGTLARN